MSKGRCLVGCEFGAQGQLWCSIESWIRFPLQEKQCDVRMSIKQVRFLFVCDLPTGP